mgnify:CR=1 FL=1
MNKKAIDIDEAIREYLGDDFFNELIANERDTYVVNISLFGRNGKKKGRITESQSYFTQLSNNEADRLKEYAENKVKISLEEKEPQGKHESKINAIIDMMSRKNTDFAEMLDKVQSAVTQLL